jgi:hypothetical protein
MKKAAFVKDACRILYIPFIDTHLPDKSHIF